MISIDKVKKTCFYYIHFKYLAEYSPPNAVPSHNWLFLSTVVEMTSPSISLFIIYFQFHPLFFLKKVCGQYHTILPGNLYCPQADVTILDERRINCDVTIFYVYFDVALNLLSNHYVNYFF
jgi:hypothetical protein